MAMAETENYVSVWNLLRTSCTHQSTDFLHVASHVVVDLLIVNESHFFFLLENVFLEVNGGV